jgi:hypothetical protein
LEDKGMSDVSVFVAIFALAMANTYLFVFMDKWIVSRADAIATGTFGGAGSPFKHRRYRLQADIVINTGTLILALGIQTIGWLMIGRNASGDIRLFAYLVAFGMAVGALGWIVTLPVDYRHLASILREAEAD